MNYGIMKRVDAVRVVRNVSYVLKYIRITKYFHVMASVRNHLAETWMLV